MRRISSKPCCDLRIVYTTSRIRPMTEAASLLKRSSVSECSMSFQSKPIRVGEDRGRLLERDTVLLVVECCLPQVPREHTYRIYTISAQIDRRQGRRCLRKSVCPGPGHPHCSA